MRVVMFCGGSGSGVLSRQLVANPSVDLTLAVNGYDDGASTGRIRRFLGRSLGPSDFRKDAGRLARDQGSCPEDLVKLFDQRFPPATDGAAVLCLLRGERRGLRGSLLEVANLHDGLDARWREPVASRLARVAASIDDGRQPPSWDDCSVGNVAFAGCYLHTGGDFNGSVDDYCALLGLRCGQIENVTDGEDAYLVALTADGRFLSDEEQIVASDTPNTIDEIFLIDHRPTADEVSGLTGGGGESVRRHLEACQVRPAPNPRLLARLGEADLILYAPGTQHSSLLPSYLTVGIGDAIAANVAAVKVLITNIREDAEILDSSASDIIERAAYYLTHRHALDIPLEFLITHYILNEPGRGATEEYVPLGRLESLEDPRLVRIGNFEDGVSGRHDAAAVLEPFVDSILAARKRQRVAVLLTGTESSGKLYQSILEMIRAGTQELPSQVVVFLNTGLAERLVSRLPVAVRVLEGSPDVFPETAADEGFDYVVLFDSSGRYRGDDIVNVVSLLTNGRLDAIWGSRRLSINDIRASYRLRYRHQRLMGAVSYVGSHVLSLACLVLYGRYISDTLSGVRAIRTDHLRTSRLDLRHPAFNQRLLSVLLRQRAEIFETPVQFFSVSPERGGPNRLSQGLRAFVELLWWRIRTI